MCLLFSRNAPGLTAGWKVRMQRPSGSHKHAGRWHEKKIVVDVLQTMTAFADRVVHPTIAWPAKRPRIQAPRPPVYRHPPRRAHRKAQRCPMGGLRMDGMPENHRTWRVLDGVEGFPTISVKHYPQATKDEFFASQGPILLSVLTYLYL